MRSPNGTRKIAGRYYMLAGRGEKAAMLREAAEARKHWRYVRILPYNPFHKKDLRDLLDDWSLWVFERRAR